MNRTRDKLCLLDPGRSRVISVYSRDIGHILIGVSGVPELLNWIWRVETGRGRCIGMAAGQGSWVP